MMDLCRVKDKRTKMETVTKQYLLSDKYVQDFLVGYSGDLDSFLQFHHDADQSTGNYNTRHYPHGEHVKVLGGWRWKGLFTHRELFVEKIFSDTLKGVDFGGSQRPIAKHIDIVDIEDKDYYNRPVKYKKLSEVEYNIDYIFSSHTLEHLPNLEEILGEMYDALGDNGTLLINVPAYTCRRWQAGMGLSMGGTPHLHTFKLKKNRDHGIHSKSS